MLTSLLTLILILVVLAMAVAPLESLGWWSSRGAQEAAETVQELSVTDDGIDTPVPYSRYVVYLSGVGAIDGNSIPEEEAPVIAALTERLPGACVISDVFPYSVSNRGLTAQRPMAALWRWVEKLRLKNPESAAGMLINARNALQLFVCADRRYGPAYNIGTAQEVIKALRRNGYQFDTETPVALIGWSGGAQIALGASWYLGMGKMPIDVVSIGGMMSDDYGLDRIRKVWHLAGSRDPLQKMGGVLFAGRWPHAAFSPWTKAMKEGRIDIIDLGPMRHNATEHYFDTKTLAPDGRTYLQVTIDAVIAVLTDQPVKTIPAGSPAKKVDG